MHCIHCGTEQPANAAFCPGCGRGNNKQSDWTDTVAAICKFILWFALAVVVLFAAISATIYLGNERVREGKPLVPVDRVIINTVQTLNDGQGMSWKLADGRYRLEMTASDGCTVEWLGGSCPATQPMRQLTTQCELTSPGQLIIKNPTTFGLGPQSSVTVKVTRLAF